VNGIQFLDRGEFEGGSPFPPQQEGGITISLKGSGEARDERAG